MSYKHDYHRPTNPLQNYYSNIPVDPKGTQIKKYFHFYEGSRAQRTSLWSKARPPMLKTSLSRKRKNPSLSQATPAINSKKLSQAPASTKMASIPTSSLRLSRDHSSTTPVKNATRSSLPKSPRNFLKFPMPSAETCPRILSATLPLPMKEYTDNQMRTKSRSTLRKMQNGSASTTDMEEQNAHNSWKRNCMNISSNQIGGKMCLMLWEKHL